MVVDLVYASEGPPWSRRPHRRGVVLGPRVLLDQALGQFRMMTGRELPEQLAREALAPDPTAGPDGWAPDPARDLT